jgi:hypothetical protein
VGTRVEVTGGPFAGLTGREVEDGGGYQFVVEIEFTGRGVAFPLDHWMFRRLGQAICESPVRNSEVLSCSPPAGRLDCAV